MAPKSIFISYQRKSHSDLASLIQTRLTNLNYAAFLDRNDIIPGSIFSEDISRKIASCDTFIVILGETTLESEYVRQEVEIALNYKKLIIPVTTPGFSWQTPLPESIKDLKKHSDASSRLTRRTRWFAPTRSIRSTRADAPNTSALC
ncbi:MAG: toll/interleukin-1 receptor domain-containing protein [Anaerolineae bacterium]|nr:toll/interleukin-1 receptor domain-containing protein [Anaerolineae bacterium]